MGEVGNLRRFTDGAAGSGRELQLVRALSEKWYHPGRSSLHFLVGPRPRPPRQEDQRRSALHEDGTSHLDWYLRHGTHNATDGG